MHTWSSAVCVATQVNKHSPFQSAISGLGGSEVRTRRICPRDERLVRTRGPGGGSENVRLERVFLWTDFQPFLMTACI